MNYIYFIKCANCGYPLATETYFDFAYVGQRNCTNCGFWETNPNLPDASSGVDPESVRADLHKELDRSLECKSCGSAVTVVDDYCQSDYDYRITVFCPSCWSYKRFAETDIQPEPLYSSSPPDEAVSAYDVRGGDPPEKAPGGITL